MKCFIIARGTPKSARTYALARAGEYFCRMCGVSAGQIHPHNGKPVVLRVEYTSNKIDGLDNMDNFHAACSICRDGMKILESKRLLAALRRADIAAQKTAFEWLRKKI